MGSTANTLTNLIPTLYLALDKVSRELVGFIPAVTRDSSLERAAVGQTVRSFVAPAATAGEIAPDVTPPDDGQQTIGNITLAIDHARRAPIRWQGEESMQMNSPGGPTVNAIMVDQFAQAMRTLVNEIEADLAGLYVNASRAIVPNSSTLFSATLKDAAAVLKILLDNGAPINDLQCVIDTTTGAAMRGLSVLNAVDTSGDKDLLRQGLLGDIMGLKFRESAQVITPAVGTSVNSTVDDDAAHAVGDTAITLSAGTGTVVAGDVVTIVGDTNHYINKTLTSDPNADGLVLNENGLRVGIPIGTADPAVAVRASSSRSMAFAKSAIVLATRAPALPAEGDMAVDRTFITDPRSGLSFEVAKYMQYRQVQYEISIAWGLKVVKEAHVALLAGA